MLWTLDAYYGGTPLRQQAKRFTSSSLTSF